MENHREGRIEPEYTMQVVVSRTGVPAETIRSWERRHGFPRPARDGTNQRLYSESDIRAIIGLNELRAGGWSIPKAIIRLETVTPPGPVAMQPISAVRTQSTSPPAVIRLPSSFDVLAERLDDFDGETVRRALNDELVFRSVEDVCFSLLLPMAKHVGVSNERHAFRTVFIRQLLFAMYNASSPETGRDTIMLAGVPGTIDESLLLCHAICMSRAGYRTMMLGMNVPLNETEAAIAAVRPHAVLTAADNADSAWTLARWAHRMNVDRPVENWNGILLFCGSVFRERPELADDVEAVQIPDRSAEAIVVLERELADPSRSLRILRES